MGVCRSRDVCSAGSRRSAGRSRRFSSLCDARTGRARCGADTFESADKLGQLRFALDFKFLDARQDAGEVAVLDAVKHDTDTLAEKLEAERKPLDLERQQLGTRARGVEQERQGSRNAAVADGLRDRRQRVLEAVDRLAQAFDFFGARAKGVDQCVLQRRQEIDSQQLPTLDEFDQFGSRQAQALRRQVQRPRQAVPELLPKFFHRHDGFAGRLSKCVEDQAGLR